MPLKRWLMTALLCCVPSLAHADDSCTLHISFVKLTAASELSAALAPHLRAELAARDIGVCVDEGPASRTPMAEITVLSADAGVTLTIRDLVTHKRVERELDLSGMPNDTRLLAIATSIDELLRASWLETLLTTPRESPALVRRAVEAVLPSPPPLPPPAPPRRVRAELGAGALLAVIPGLRTAGGFDVSGTVWLGSHWGAYTRIGYARGVAQDSLNGSIAADAIRGGAGAAFSLWPVRDRFGVRFEAGLDALGVSFRGAALDRASVRDPAALFAATATLGVRSWVDAGPVRLLLGLAGQYALAPVIGTDQSVSGQILEVTGVRGVGLEASLGAAWAF